MAEACHAKVREKPLARRGAGEGAIGARVLETRVASA